MKVSLIYPPFLRPGRGQNNECFLLPPFSLPSLAKCLKTGGHSSEILDYSVFFHKLGETGRYAGTDFSVLSDKDKTLRYLQHGENSAAFKKIEKAFLSWRKPARADLYGISLTAFEICTNADNFIRTADMGNLFILNAAALLANLVKKQYSAPVVIGNDQLGKSVYRRILSRYPCFDFGVYSKGAASLIRLTEHLADKSVPPVNLWENTASGVVDRPGEIADMAVGADYGGAPLKMYMYDMKELFSRYDESLALAKKQLRGRNGGRQLVVPYQFDKFCRGRCAFCMYGENSARSPQTVDQAFEDLCRLKELGVTGVLFTNTSFNNSYAFAEELCDKMIKAGLDLLWCDCANLRELDEKLLQKMKKAGAVRLTWGLETASDKLLKFTRKGVTAALAEKYLRYSGGLGIWNAVELMAGLPYETNADVEETAAFLNRNARNIDSYELNKFRLLPHSPFYKNPPAFRLRMLGDRLDGIDNQTFKEDVNCTAFDEIDGLRWPEKMEQAARSEKRIRETLIPHRCVYDSPQHMQLLMSLYRAFGHSNKELIRTLFYSAAKRHKPYASDSFQTSDWWTRALDRPAGGAR